MKNLKVGLQLFSVGHALQADFEGTLKAVKEMGYDYVEFAGGFPMSAEEVKAILDKYDLKTVSIHWDPLMYRDDPEQAMADLKLLGIKYSAIPGVEVKEYFDNWDATIKKFADLGKMLHENDLQLIYHNHESEFLKIDGEYILEKIFSTIPNEYLAPQFDTCWVQYAGENAAEYLLKYTGKINVVHLKDFTCDALATVPGSTRKSNNMQFAPVGYGMQDWKAILEAVVKAGAEYVIVEQDCSPSGDPLGDAKKSREYLKNTFGI